MQTTERRRGEAGLTTRRVKLPPIRCDRRALDALCAAARTAVENATNAEPEEQDRFESARVRFSATFQRGRWRQRESVAIDETDIDRLSEPVRTTDWSVNATRYLATASEHSIRIHAGIGHARLIVTSPDAAWRSAAIASILDVARAHAPKHRWSHHWTARAGTGMTVGLATAAAALLTAEGVTATDAALTALDAVVLGGWGTALHAMASNRRSHVLRLEPNEKSNENT